MSGIHSLLTFLLRSKRVPTFLGSIENVFELDQFYKYYSDSDDDEDGDGADESPNGEIE